MTIGRQNFNNGVGCESRLAVMKQYLHDEVESVDPGWGVKG